MALHIRTTPELKQSVAELASINGVTESIVVEWAIERLLKVAKARDGRLVCLELPKDREMEPSAA